ncbi:MAG: COX15/CtaA family protein [Anaerolineales bacterium]|nr:COX15/CtaA family protein [Anaerolineales bacterium]
MILTRFAKYAWFVLAFNLGVILWGAYVRATGSGAGCGSHWPLCNGEVIPQPDQIETLIEFTHRLSSGIAFLLVVGMLVWAWRIFPRGHRVRYAAIFSMIFMITEALVGAGLVLFELVAENTSSARALAISVHLVNTFILLACISLTAWWASGGKPVQIRWGNVDVWLLLVGFLGVLILGMSGALTALGDTLFPVNSLEEGIRQDFSAAAHFLVRLRILHPTIAVIVAVYLIFVINWINSRVKRSLSRQISWVLITLFVMQLLAGAINVLLLAPVWMQMVHLLLSDLVWISLVLFSAEVMAKQDAQRSLENVTDSTNSTKLSEA